MSKYTKSEVDVNIKELAGWSTDYKSLQKEFTFKSFADAIAFVVKLSFDAEKVDHHPDILIHSWNKVKITLSTHSIGGITQKDFELAKIFQSLNS